MRTLNKPSTAALFMIAAVIAAMVFLFDLLLPLGVAAGVPYVAPVLLGLWASKTRYVFYLAAIGTILTGLGYLYSTAAGIEWMVLTNRALAFFVIWSAAGLVAMQKRSQDALSAAQDDLERRVHDRTIELSESESRFRDFANAASDWFWEMGPDLKFTYFSDRHYEITGFRPEDKIGTMRTKNVDPREFAADEAKWAAHFADLDARRPFKNFEYAFTVDDGSIRHTRISGVPVFDASGEFAGYRGTGSDITEQKRAEENSDQLIAAFDSLPIAIHLWGPDGRLIVTNRTQHEWFPEQEAAMQPGAKLEDYIRLNVKAEMVDAPPDDFEAYVAERLENFKNPTTTVSERQHIGGRWLQVINKRLPNGSIVGIRLDVTDSRQSEELLHQAQKMQAVGQLTGGVAHDFNNLLAIIMGNLELLLEQTERGSKIFTFGENALNATRRGADLTHRLLAFSRKQSLAPVSVDIDQLVRGIQHLLIRTLGENMEIELVSGTGLWRCHADPRQLENVILNLSINARDAMPQGGHLTIETANVNLDEAYAATQEDVTPGQYVQLAISDTGSGMPPEVMAQAFDPFFTTKEAGKGSGLGLSMIYGFVKQSGGHARIYSEVGKGTTVKIYLPRSDAGQHTGPAATAPAAIDRAKRDEVILVVEDDADLRAMAVSILGELGHHVFEAGTASAALAQFEKCKKINLLLTDVILPGGLNGRQLADRACALAPDLKVLYMSGYSENAIMHNGRLDPGVEMLAKPFGRAELATKIRDVLDRPS